MGSPLEIAAAAHLPDLNGRAITALRVEGFDRSVEERCRLLPAVVQDYCQLRRLDELETESVWSAARTVAPLAREEVLWRLTLPPSRAADVLATVAPDGARWLCDWAGGLIWLGTDAEPAQVRRAAEAADGHAMLVRAPAAMRNHVPAQHPRSRGVMALEARVRRAFDPAGVFETDRFLDEANAD
jgi:glycolate oxidase FAD binding subunit